MRVERRFTADGKSPYSGIEFRSITSEIRNPDGSVVFRLEDVKVPAKWSQVASDIIAQKYFRKAGVPTRLKKKIEDGSLDRPRKLRERPEKLRDVRSVQAELESNAESGSPAPQESPVNEDEPPTPVNVELNFSEEDI